MIIGNDALVKCSVPSYAADFMEIVGWVTNEDYEITNLVDGNQNNWEMERLLFKDDGLHYCQVVACFHYYFLSQWGIFYLFFTAW